MSQLCPGCDLEFDLKPTDVRIVFFLQDSQYSYLLCICPACQTELASFVPVETLLDLAMSGARFKLELKADDYTRTKKADYIQRVQKWASAMAEFEEDFAPPPPE